MWSHSGANRVETAGYSSIAGRKGEAAGVEEIVRVSHAAGAAVRAVAAPHGNLEHGSAGFGTFAWPTRMAPARQRRAAWLVKRGHWPVC